MLDVVAQAAEARQLKNITTRQGYAESLPFADNALILLSAVILPITGMMLVQHCEK
ncbi:putative methyltransferase [Escherichia coli]|uniref:Putative methyltransferase n=1 Tax=Escherichia coli TaxID=562 RepID=A0A377DK13_ECOLX|nr:putative methyltransferase [Escherichia coli]